MREDNEANKLILLLLIIGGFIGLIFFLTRSVPSVLYTENQIRSTLSSVSVKIPESNVTVDLIGGSATFENGENEEGTVTLSPPYLAIKTDEGYDFYGVMRHSMGGVEEYVSIAIFEEDEGEATYRGAYLIGDRVNIADIDGPDEEQEGAYSIRVDYLEHEEFELKLEPPSVERTINLDIENHQIVTPPQEDEQT